MKKFFLISAAFAFVSCSTYNVESEIREASLNNYTKSGILLRLGGMTPVSKMEFELNLKNWIDGYKKNNKLLILEKVSEKISTYDSEIAQFYQLSDDDSFLLNKSRGTVAAFYRNNQEELKSIFTSNDLDSLIIYEIDSFYSTGIQKIGFKSVMVIIDADGNIGFLDHQADTFEIEEFIPNPEKSKRILADKVCKRFIDELIKLNYIEEM